MLSISSMIIDGDIFIIFDMSLMEVLIPRSNSIADSRYVNFRMNRSMSIDDMSISVDPASVSMTGSSSLSTLIVGIIARMARSICLDLRINFLFVFPDCI